MSGLLHSDSVGYAVGFWEDGDLSLLDEGYKFLSDAQAALAEEVEWDGDGAASTIADKGGVVYALLPLSAFGGAT